MESSFYSPPAEVFQPGATRKELEDQISLCKCLMEYSDQNSPTYKQEVAHHTTLIDLMEGLLEANHGGPEKDCGTQVPFTDEEWAWFSGNQPRNPNTSEAGGFDAFQSGGGVDLSWQLPWDDSEPDGSPSSYATVLQNSLKRKPAPEPLDLFDRKRISTDPSPAVTPGTPGSLSSPSSLDVGMGQQIGQNGVSRGKNVLESYRANGGGLVERPTNPFTFTPTSEYFEGQRSGPTPSSRDSARPTRAGVPLHFSGRTDMTPTLSSFNLSSAPNPVNVPSSRMAQGFDGHGSSGAASGSNWRDIVIDLTEDDTTVDTMNTPTQGNFASGNDFNTGFSIYTGALDGDILEPYRNSNSDPFGDLDSNFTRQQIGHGADLNQALARVNASQNSSNTMTVNELGRFATTPTLQNFHGLGFRPDFATGTVFGTGFGAGIHNNTSTHYPTSQLPIRPPQPNPAVYASSVKPEPGAQGLGFPMRAASEEAPEALTKLLKNIRPDEEIPPELREPTPSTMACKLMEHQKVGLAWLKKMEETAKGGILADDMGLGKTIQALALILARPSEDPARKTTLIVAPVALMRQWVAEIHDHVRPEHRLKVFTYHGNGKGADFAKLRTCDVVLTTFGTLAQEYKKMMKYLENGGLNESRQKQFGLLGPGCRWYRVIIDEAQSIKNRNTLNAKACFELISRYRLCMTGTPMMNSVEDLYSLIKFLRIAPYNDWSRFNFDINKPVKDAKEGTTGRNQGIERVQVLLKSIMLRRTKDSKVDGKPIIVIPPKHTHHEEVILSKDERDLYTALETKSQLKFNKYLQKGTVNNNYASILVLLLRLRQACCHPHLIKDLGVQVATEGISEDRLLKQAENLGQTPAVVNRLLEEDGFECPICFDGTDNPTIFVPCGHSTCGECFQKLIDSARAQGGEENSTAKCPECRCQIGSDHITDFVHFLKVFLPGKLVDLEKEGLVVHDADDDSASDDDSDSDSDSDSESDGADDGDDLDGFIVPDDVDDSSVSSPQTPVNEHKSKGKEKKKGSDKPKKTLADLKKESLRNKEAKRKYLKRLRRNWTTSAKIEKTLELLQEIYENDATEKTLIFSQFTSLLDLLEVPMQERKIPYQRYDGSMDSGSRADAVQDFMRNPNTRVMIISLKAGNSGLNLNKASQVIVLDPFWNPYIEDQAVDRAHRMRQEREVHVHRILAPETVEDRICALQDKKREIISAALDENAARSLVRLGVQDLMYLFGVGGNRR